MQSSLYTLVLLCLLGIVNCDAVASSNSTVARAGILSSNISVRAVPGNSSRAHYYIFPDKLEPTPSPSAGWSSSSTADYGWTTISPTNAGWPSSTTTDYGGWATSPPNPPGWSPPVPAPLPSNNGWSSPTPSPPPNNGWGAPTSPPASPPSNGWSPPPPSNNGGWSPAAPTPGWMAPGGCTTAGCVFLENYIVANIINSSSYHKQLRPPPYDNPTSVSVDIFIKNILYVDDSTKMWKAQLTLRQQWNDPRLAYSIQGCSSYKYFTLTSADSIWTPDLFFPLEEEAYYHSVPQTNVLVWISPNGDVTYSTRITLTMNCRGKKTATELSCPLIVGSYAYSSDKMRLQWLQPDPVQIDLDRIDLDNYVVGKVATSGNGDPTAYLGQFPGVVAKFTFVKKQNQCQYGYKG